tara:strand:- start:1048 stop:2136 length:1089 start_codon:yes stop_codon:yes gene_type:complete
MKNKSIVIGDYTLIPTRGQSHKDWLEARSHCIGGSDVGVLYNLNEWYSSTQLFYEKLGRTDPKDLSENASVHYGSAFEDVVLRDSQFCDPNGKENNHIKNFNDGKKLASHVPFPYMVSHNSFPYLLANVDGLGFKDKSITEQDVIDMVEKEGRMPNPDYIVEIKTQDSYVKDKFQGGLNPSYEMQVKAYCTIFLDQNPEIYGMLYTFCYDKTLTAHNVQIDQSDIEGILTVSKKFHNLLGQGKEIIDEGYKSNLNEDEIDQNLSQIHPEPKTSVISHGKFLSDKFLAKEFVKNNQTIKGNDEDIELGLRYHKVNAEIKTLTKEKTTISNQFKSKLVKERCKVIDCSPRGRVSYGKRLTNTIK